MQQQLCPQEQMSNQQQPQHVMLCPVRLVYETQILVQPGEQIHPNQALFINPQNPPPWIQNRPQNQVIYMQPMPNNLMPSMQQHMDQNQLYIQNYAYPQPMINQMEPMRQMPNVMTQNMMGIGSNGAIGQNVGQMQNLSVGQNVMPMTNVVQNVQKVAPGYSQNVGNDRIVYSTVPNVNSNIAVPNSHAMTNVNQMQERQQMNQNLVNMQKVSELQGIKQQTNRQPQVTVSPMQNVKFGPSASDVRPATRPQMTNGNNMNVVPNVQANAMKNKVPVANKVNPNVMTNQVRHYNQYYRPIQPRPMSVMPMVQNQYLPMQTGNISVPRPQTQINTELNRKRKSESPDETRKKIPNVNQTVTTMPNNNVQNQMVNIVHSDIGVNTNPVQREVKPVRNVETMSTGTQANIAREKPQIDNVQKTLENKGITTNLIKDNMNVNIQSENDKLLRNTVFTQARGLLRTEPQMLLPDIISIEKIQNIIPHATNVVENTSIEAPEIVKEVVNKEVSPEVKLNERIKKEVTTDTVKETISNKPVKKEITDSEKESLTIKQEIAKVESNIKTEIAKAELKTETTEITKNEIKEKKTEKSEAKDAKDVSKKVTVTAISDFKGNEIQIADGSVRKEETDSYILTHVLDGYVIQESNIAFPIRKPLKEKTIYQNMDFGTEQRKEETTYKHRTEDGKVIKDNSRILAISDLNLSEDDQIKSDDDDEKSDETCDENPFADLNTATVKSWTVDALAAHLSKYKWTETISVLLEHEIDGESLFLVSKPQLVQIGVSEAHADIICEFIKI